MERLVGYRPSSKERRVTQYFTPNNFGEYSGERAVNPLHVKTSSEVVQVVQFLYSSPNKRKETI